VFFIFGVSSLLFFKQTRDTLIKHKFWLNIVVFILLISPNILWQVVNDFPVLKMFSRLYEVQLNNLTPLEVLSGMLMALNPMTLLMSVAAIVAMFHRTMRSYLPIIVSIVLSTLLLAFSKGKGYYFYSIALTVLPFGAVYWENILLVKRKWMIYPVVLALCMGVFLIPFGMPVFPLQSYLIHDYPYEKQEIPGGQFAVRFEERYSTEKWALTMKELQNVYDSLPEKENIIIWGKHYSQAGAVNLFGANYGLPNAFSLHGSFYNWAPLGDMPATMIAFSYNSDRFFPQYFDEVIKVRTIYNPYSANEKRLYQHIYICRKPKQTLAELKDLFKDRIYE
jgi:hypothetical protein